MTCPKCSGARIIGPHYEQGPYGGERLRYVCSNCGYSYTRPTHDSEAKGLSPEVIAAAARRWLLRSE